MLNVLANKLTPLRLDNWTTIVADHRSLPVESATVDLAISGWSICYLTNSSHTNWQSNIEIILSKIKRVLKPNGTIIIFETMGTGTETPNPQNFWRDIIKLLKRNMGLNIDG